MEDDMYGPPNRPAVLFYNRPGSVTTLRASYRRKLHLPDSAAFLKELQGESDRAAIILASSLLDDLLANAIALAMPLDILVEDMETVFRQGGPLGSFSARIEIASLFGVIERETYEQLSLLREMRNACAHTKHPITFEDPILANVALNLFSPRGSFPRELAAKNLKAAFSFEVSFLTMVLGLGSRRAATAERDQAMKEIVEKARASLKTPTSD